MSQERARQIAQQRVPGATVTETDLCHEHGQAVWEVELTNQHREYEVTIDAVTGQVIHVSPNPVQPTATASADASPSATLTPDQARQIAQQLVPGATVTETDLCHEHGRSVWEVKLTTDQHRESEVTIDAVTGNVTHVDHDTDAEDHD